MNRNAPTVQRRPLSVPHARGDEPPETVELITVDQLTAINDMLSGHKEIEEKLLKRYGVMSNMPANAYTAAIEWIKRQCEQATC